MKQNRALIHAINVGILIFALACMSGREQFFDVSLANIRKMGES